MRSAGGGESEIPTPTLEASVHRWETEAQSSEFPEEPPTRSSSASSYPLGVNAGRLSDPRVIRDSVNQTCVTKRLPGSLARATPSTCYLRGATQC